MIGTQKPEENVFGNGSMNNLLVLKQQVAAVALQFIQSNQVVGIGTGSTITCFIETLANSGIDLMGAVASSQATALHLKSHSITVLPSNTVESLPMYIDSADYIDAQFHLIKGGGGALTQEKVIATASAQFICLVDAHKWQEDFNKIRDISLPIEVLPIAQAFVEKQLRAMGGRPTLRTGFITDNGNIILDVKGLDWSNPLQLEEQLDHLPGTVANGLFARRRPNLVLLATNTGVRRLEIPR